MAHISRAPLLVALLYCLSAAVAFGQYGAGTILGTITDPTRAVVPGVKVTAKNNATNETRVFTTDSEGNYQFTALPRGTYTLSAAAASFRTATVPNVELLVNMQVRVDVVMQLGQVAETVEVTAAIPQLQTNTAALGTVVDNRTMLELPLIQRNFFDLVALTPGVVKSSGASSVMDEKSAMIGGVRNDTTNATLDGVDFTVANANNPAVNLSLDVLEEFKVQMNFMDASYGHGAAGIEMVTKRGSNAFHGVLFEFARNRAFQAGQFFRPPSGAPRFSYNQFGGNAGGKIIRDKIFFFANYQGMRRRTGVIQQGWVPTGAMYQGDFSGLTKTLRDPFNNNQPLPGNIVPKSRFDPIAQKMLPLFPLPNFENRRPGVNFLLTPSEMERRDQATGRIDHRVSEKGTLFGRYTYADDALQSVAYRVGKGMIRPDHTQHLSVGYTHLFSSNLISESRLGFTRAWLARVGDGERFSKNYAREYGFKNLVAVPGEYTEPSISLSGYSPSFGGYGSYIDQNNLYYRVSETVNYIRGRHSLKVGGDANRLMLGFERSRNQNGILSFSVNYTGDSMANYLLGIPASAVGGLGDWGNYGGVAKYFIGTLFQYFIQDDWKLTDRLTLNLGFRHEIFMQWRGRMANYDLATGRQLIANSPDYFIPGKGLVKGSGAPLLPSRPVPTDPNNVAPRLGLAYRFGEKTTMRAGAGVFYALHYGADSQRTMTIVAPFYIEANMSSSPLRPEIFLSDLFPTPQETPTSVPSMVDPKRTTGYIYQYNLNIQHQIRPGLLFETGYMGNTGQKLQGNLNINQARLPRDPARPEPLQSRMPYPDLPVTFWQCANYQWSNYNAWFFKVEQRLSRGLSYTVAYTWPKTISSGGAGQNSYYRRAERSTTGPDHNFVAGYVYDLPVGKGRPLNISNRALDFFAGGWELAGITNFRSGGRFTISTTGDIAMVGVGSQRANATGVSPKKLNPRTNNLMGLDPAAYSTPPAGTFGNVGLNTQPAFGTNNWDVSVSKNFRVPGLGESSRLQFRAEWFNFFNHTQFNNPAATVNVPATFGRVSSARDPRIMQLGGKLYW